MEETSVRKWINPKEKVPSDDVVCDVTVNIDGQRVVLTKVMYHRHSSTWIFYDSGEDIDDRVIAWTEHRRPKPYLGAV